MKIYTRTGDAGSTGLFGGPRVSKDDVRIEAYGTIDELNAVLGVIRAAGVETVIDQQLATIQSDLFSLGAELASPDPDRFDLRVIAESHVERLESWIDQFETQLAPLHSFILPGGTSQAAHVHLARTICRRAERRLVTLSQTEGPAVSPISIVFLNRLSDYFFVLSRTLNRAAGVPDVEWHR